MRGFHGLCSCLADLCQDRDIANCIQFLNVRRVHMRKAQILETISTQIGVIAHVQKLAAKIRLRFNFDFLTSIHAVRD